MVTSDEQYVEPLTQLREQGQSEKYYHPVVGYNYRMEALQGAVLGVKLKHLDNWNEARRECANIYRAKLADSGLRLLEQRDGYQSVHHIFPVFTDRRDELREHLLKADIGTGLHYPIPVHLQPGYLHLGYRQGDLPETERACAEVLSLPMYPELPHETVSQIADTVRQFCRPTLEAAHP